VTIISHQHRFVFVAVPKVASHSIRFALRPFLDDNDEEQVSLFVRKRIDRPGFSNVEHGHQLAREIRDALSADVWSRYVSFAVVRNPWARFVSYVAFMMRHNGLFMSDPQAAMRRVLANPQNQSPVHFRAQADFVTDENGRVMVSHLLRAESLQADFDALCQALSLPQVALETRNASEHRDYREYYDEDLVRRVAERYRVDIDLFGYRFDGESKTGTAG
jgi:hypothetical protein